MRSGLIALSFIAAFVFFPYSSAAFETETHALITRTAYDRSELNKNGPGTLADRLGLNRLNTASPFVTYWTPSMQSRYYQDGGVSGTADHSIEPASFERCQMREFLPSNNRFLPSIYRGLFNNTVPATGNDLLPIQNWLVRGAIREDDLGNLTGISLGSMHCSEEMRAELTQGHIDPDTRVFNHFYDPYWDVPLTPCFPIVGCNSLGIKSVDWALGNLDSFAAAPQENGDRLNHYSYRDARNAYYWALTRELGHESGVPDSGAARVRDAVDRMQLWATVFRSLGNVVHLLEDTAQPQHTRNDAHSPTVTTDQQQAFEGYTNARVLGSESGSANPYVRSFFSESTQLTAPSLGNYDPVMFSTPLRFFTTRGGEADLMQRAGLADFTNRGFFTGGTQPGQRRDFVEPLPPNILNSDGTPANGFDIVATPCEGLRDADTRLRAITCKHYVHSVPDVVNPAYPDELPPGFALPQVPLSSESIFARVTVGEAFDFTDYIAETALSIAELDTIGNMTIPRAIGYAAGMLDYFFRGQLEVLPPDDGIYAILDHGVPHTVDADGLPRAADGTKVFGFDKLRVKLRNSTPALTDAGSHRVVAQTTGGDGATLVAVVRYHRNPCYTPGLGGERGVDYQNAVHSPSNCTIARLPYPEISVSEPLAVSANALDGTNANLATFYFVRDPIPINATDVFIQVVYRGRLGDEADGIAVGSVDASEPTYFSLYNLGDYLQDSSGAMQRWPASRGVPNIGNLNLCFATATDYYRIYSISQAQQLTSNQIVRLAVIGDFSPHYWSFKAWYTDPNLVDLGPIGFFDAPIWTGSVRQASTEAGEDYAPQPMSFMRGFNAGDVGRGFTAYVSDYTGTGAPPIWSTIPDIAASAGLNSSAAGTLVQSPQTVPCN